MPGNLMTNTPARDAFNNAVQAICGASHAAPPRIRPRHQDRHHSRPARIILSISSRVETAVTGGTPVFGVSYVATGGTAPAVGTSGNIQDVLAEAAGSEHGVPLAALVQPLTTDTDFYVGTTGAAPPPAMSTSRLPSSSR